MLGWLKRLFAPRSRSEPRPRSTYDAAQTSDNNARHWSYTDALSARQANKLEVRKILRERARYEYANNSYCQGMIQSWTHNLIGTGPRLQVLTGNDEDNRQIEAAWKEWAHAIRLADKLRIMATAKKVDGEAFGLLFTNPALPTSVQLDLKPIECDQVTRPFFAVPLLAQGDYVDGIEFDEHGNVALYHVLKVHPGASGILPLAHETERIEARSMIHWFRADRPGQARGIPEITPALPLFAQLRRFTLATIRAAETAASFAVLLRSELPPNDDADPITPFDSLEIEHNMMTALPSGYVMDQLKAEHPATTYEMFTWAILREIARCLSMPLNIAAGDSSKSNFASARLDHIIHRQAVTVERTDGEREALEVTFSEWLNEATKIPGLLPANVPAFAGSLPHVWHWPAWMPIDPDKEAKSEKTQLDAGTTTLAAIALSHGGDWRELIRQQIAEEVFRNEERERAGLGPAVQAPAPAPDDEDEEAEEEAQSAAA